jgi:LmbE family N-acetylglucosaminyl deacetylase
MQFSGKRICFIGAHPDDIELGCGGLISSLPDKTNLFCVTLSDNQRNPSLSNLVVEHQASMKSLGIPASQVILEQFETRKFPSLRQGILEYLIKIGREIKPDIVFVHTRADLHQDHNTVTDEALRAFRGVTVLGFDVIRSSYGFFPNLLVPLQEIHLAGKLAALSQYLTYAGKYYFDPDLTRSILVRYGALCESKYAEGFETLRIIGNFS